MDDVEDIRYDIIVLRKLIDAVRDRPEYDRTLLAFKNILQEREERLERLERR